MPKGIGARGIGGRAGVARRQIGSRYALTSFQEPFTFPPGTYSFTPPKNGNWKFVGWGAGGGTTAGSGQHGASGGYGEKTKYLTSTQTVAVVVGTCDSGGAGGSTTITFPDGTTLTCTGATANSVAVGTSTGGDVNLSGSAGALTGGASSPAGSGTGGGLGGANNGAGAPANLPYRGGEGGGNILNDGSYPGAGAKATGSNQRGGDGQVIVSFIRD